MEPDVPVRCHNDDWILAYQAGIGAIYRCSQCRDIHVLLGSAQFQLDASGFVRLVEMFSRSAANFEIMLEVEGGAR